MAQRTRDRPNLPRGKSAPLPSVFINCPFDEEYAPLLDAILLTTACCGFVPRSALESETTSESRINRILHSLRGSGYSIHDLSRCTGEGSMNLARFNMPLELGMAMALRGVNKPRHDWLVLVPEGHLYKQFVSDLAGFDPGAHDGTAEKVVVAVAAWLLTRPDAVATATRPDKIIRVLPRFRRDRARLAKQWKGNPPWGHVVRIAFELAERLGST